MTAKMKSLIKENKFSTFLTVVTMTLVAVFFLFFRNLSYKSGLQGNTFYYMGHFLLLMPLAGGFVVIFICAMINTIIKVLKAIKTKKTEWLRLLLTTFPLVAILGLYCFHSMSKEAGPGAWHFLRGYEKWVGENVDILTIQEWLVALPDEYSEQTFFDATDFPKELPEAITKLNPYHMNFSKFKDGQRSVMFEWGSAFGHFGIIIGLPGMETPDGEELIKHTESDFEFRRPIESGVYIFERG